MRWRVKFALPLIVPAQRSERRKVLTVATLFCSQGEMIVRWPKPKDKTFVDWRKRSVRVREVPIKALVFDDSQEPNAIACCIRYQSMTKTPPTARPPRNVVLVPGSGFSQIRICKTGRLQQALAHFGSVANVST
jgi:hypothetical protein